MIAPVCVTGMCTEKPDSGPCRAAFTMFYYDLDSASCRPFIYGGCRGNYNRYGSEDECMSSCSGGKETPPTSILKWPSSR